MSAIENIFDCLLGAVNRLILYRTQPKRDSQESTHNAQPLGTGHKNDEEVVSILDIPAIHESQSYDLPDSANAPVKHIDFYFPNIVEVDVTHTPSCLK
jgi:hypothetical protein